MFNQLFKKHSLELLLHPLHYQFLHGEVYVGVIYNTLLDYKTISYREPPWNYHLDQNKSLSLMRKCHHFGAISIIGCTESCHFDNFRRRQWRKFCQNDISVSVIPFYVNMYAFVNKRYKSFTVEYSSSSWLSHQMEAFSVLLPFCARNSSVTGEFPRQRPVTRSFDVFFDLRLE